MIKEQYVGMAPLPSVLGRSVFHVFCVAVDLMDIRSAIDESNHALRTESTLIYEFNGYVFGFYFKDETILLVGSQNI